MSRRHPEEVAAQQVTHGEVLRILTAFRFRLPERVRKFEQRFDELRVEITACETELAAVLRLAYIAFLVVS